MNKEKIGSAYMALAALCWSIGGTLVKFCQWPGFCQAIFRGCIVCVVYGILCLSSGRKLTLNRTKLLIALCYMAQNTLLTMAFKYTSAGSATAIQNTSPVFIILLNALILREKPGRRDLLTCGVMMLGVFITLGGSLGGGLAGNLLALVSALFYAGLFFLNGTSKSDTTEALVLGNLPFLLLSPVLFQNQVFIAYGLTDLLAASAYGLVSGVAAWLFFGRGIRHVSALRANFITLLEPVMSPVWALLFLKEVMSPGAMIGFIIVIGALLLYNRKAKADVADTTAG